MKKFHFDAGLITVFILLLLTGGNIYGQSIVSCTVDGKDLKTKVEDAVQVSIGSDEFVQIKSVDGDKILYLYLKISKLKDELPVTLKYVDHDEAQGQSPDAEIVWVPDGPDNPQWNTTSGEAEITLFDESNKTISGTFEFTVQKFSYGSNAKKKAPSYDIDKGKFESINYRVEEKKEGE